MTFCVSGAIRVEIEKFEISLSNYVRSASPSHFSKIGNIKTHNYCIIWDIKYIWDNYMLGCKFAYIYCKVNLFFIYFEIFSHIYNISKLYELKLYPLFKKKILKHTSEIIQVFLPFRHSKHLIIKVDLHATYVASL